MFLSHSEIDICKEQYIKSVMLKFNSFLLAQIKDISDLQLFGNALCKLMNDAVNGVKIENPLLKGFIGKDKETNEYITIDGELCDKDSLYLVTPSIEFKLDYIKLVNDIINIDININIVDKIETKHLTIDVNNQKALTSLLEWYKQIVDIAVSISYYQYNLDILNTLLRDSRSNNIYAIVNIPQFKISLLSNNCCLNIETDTIYFNVNLESLEKNVDMLFNTLIDEDRLSILVLNYLGSLNTCLQMFIDTPKWLCQLIGYKIPSINKIMKTVYTRNITHTTKKQNMYYITKQINNKTYGYVVLRGADLVEDIIVLPLFDLETGLYYREVE